ncbi:Zn-finger protein [Blastocystis sp. ATCC 50177/Nand II]|uniref:Zn-finger protein n=1 Tax=Blastocystis sp. subtype 1 (strain ATCC 50177 / NandII) TaxID=478820 RepID=A0A196S6W6_BLAHN|nr:Zn-finger protein [Blastocystis sp. ATCC 50177/Nand II]OAO15308.1 Zn-finger protein [Blastocystis sp. ATCC 50177/Nand II]
MNSQQSTIMSGGVIGQTPSSRVLTDDMGYIQVNQPIQMSMTNPMGITANAMANYPRGTMGLSVNGYTDAGISHTMNNEDLMGPNIPSIAFIQPDAMMSHQGGIQSEMTIGVIGDMNTGIDMYGNSQIDMQGGTIVDYRGVEPENRIRLRQPKRTMSAYACYSRSVFKQVREEVGDQPRQCDIFRVIAERWKKMSPEEKAPFEEEAEKDHARYKSEMQQFHKLRREVEKNVARLGTVNGGAQFKNSQLLQKAFHSHDHMRMAQLLLKATSGDKKTTLDMLNEVLKLLLTSGTTMLNEQQTLQNFFSNAGTDFASTNARKPFRCPFPGCGKEFAWKSNLNTHMHIHDNSRKKEYVCNFPNCGKAFYDAQHLRQHCWIHTRNPEGFQCPHPGCDKKYATHSGLQMHIRSHHKNEKRFVCPFEDCGKTFVRNSDLNVHVQRVHEMNHKYKCDMEGCDKSFVSQGDLKRHMLTHHHFGENVTIGMMPEEAGDMGRMV